MRIPKQVLLFLTVALSLLSLFTFWMFSGPECQAYPAISLGEMYSYTEDVNVREPLELAPRIIVQFVLSYALPEKQEEFLSKTLSGFPLREYKPEMNWNMPTNRWFVQFEETIPPAKIVEAVNLINTSEVARAEFIYLVHGIAAEMTGMVIEPKEFFSVQDLQEHILQELKKYGDFTLGAVTVSEDRSFHISFSEIKPPLTLLRLVNLAATDSWVRRAYPRFRYLHPPVTAELKVTPETGQLDEVRTVSLIIQNFAPERIQIDPKLISPLGSTEFIPKPMAGGKAKHFEVSPEPEVSRVRNGPGEIVTLTWKLRLFEVQATGAAPVGKWMLSGPSINFTDNGELKTITTNIANFFVISHLAGVVTSFPPATPLIVPEIQITPLPAAPFISSSRLDSIPLMAKLPFKPVLLSYASFILTGIFGIASLVRGRALLQQRNQQIFQGSPEKPWQEVCMQLLNEAQQDPSLESYEKVYEALSLALKNLFPGELSSHPGLSEVVENCGNQLDEKEHYLLKTIYTELEKIYRPDFTPQEETLARLTSDVRSLVMSLKRLRMGS